MIFTTGGRASRLAVTRAASGSLWNVGVVSVLAKIVAVFARRILVTVRKLQRFSMAAVAQRSSGVVLPTTRLCTLHVQLSHGYDFAAVYLHGQLESG